MNTSQFPKKVFSIGPMHNSILTNAEENTQFISTRIEKLKANPYGTPAFYKELDAVFAEFVDVYEFDKQTAVMPEPIGSVYSQPEKASNFKQKRSIYGIIGARESREIRQKPCIGGWANVQAPFITDVPV